MTIVTIGIDLTKNVFAVHGVDETGTPALVRPEVLNAAKNKTDPVSRWAIQVQARRGYWKAVVAIAAKNARMCWAMLRRGEAFKLPA